MCVVFLKLCCYEERGFDIVFVVMWCDVFDRYKEIGSIGMVILDIGILIGFKLDEKM